MATRFYPAIVERGETTFGVFFPDFPGCIGAGDSIQAAAESAASGLAFHVRGMIEDGDPIPDPTPFDRIEQDPEIDEAARIMVPLDLPGGKIVRINATLDEGLLSQIDRKAQGLGMSRSGFLAEAARRMIG